MLPDPAARDSIAAAFGFMALGSGLFATMNFLARLATATASWTTVAAVRALVGALVAFAVAQLRRSSLRAKERRLLFWRSVLGTISMLSTFYALSSRTMSLGDTVTLLNLAPVFLSILAPFFLRERTSLLVGGAISVSLAGVILVVRPTLIFGHAAVATAAAVLPGPTANATATVAVIAAFSSSITMMVLRHATRFESPETIAFHFSLFAAAVLTFLSCFNFQMPTPRGAAFMVGSGICAGFAQLAMTRAYSMASAARVSGMSYLTVVGSAILGIVWLGERPTPLAVGGMVLVIAGGVLLTIPTASSAAKVG